MSNASHSPHAAIDNHRDAPAVTLGFRTTARAVFHRLKAVIGISVLIGAYPLSASAQCEVPPEPEITITSPVNGSNLGAPPKDIAIVVSASGGGGTITRVQYYANGALIGTRTASPWNHTWTGVPEGSYALSARVTATKFGGSCIGIGQSTVVNVTVQAPNALPSVSVASPASGTVVTQPNAVAFTASASDPDGSIANVQWLANGSPIGSPVTASPYAFNWSGMGAGSYTVAARATDNRGGVTTSSGITVVINDRPSASLSLSNAVNQAPGSITLQASGSDAVGGVASVHYLRNGTVLAGPLYSAPYTYNWTNIPGDTYSLVARVTDAHGVSTDSSPQSFRVNRAPTVSIASPSNNAMAFTPASFTLTATASDSDGSITGVQYFAGGSAISGVLTSSPYTFSWTGVAAGTYSVTARATDNSGATTTSAPISVISNDRPGVTLSVNAVGTVAPGSFSLQADPSDSVGGVANVQYFANGTAISGALTSAPYSFTWSGVGAGTHSIVARATDAYGATVDSQAQSHTVYSNPPPSVVLLAPASGALYAPGSPLYLGAKTTANGNVISKVEFFDGSTPLGEASLSNGAYVLTWTGASNGSHSITARVTDSFGRTGTSLAATVSVVAPAVPTSPNLAGPVAGSLAGKGSVNSSGAATYSIPIPVPPGTAGLAPSMEFNYSSQAGTGISGQGWSLSGLSAITRCPRTLAQDGVRTGVTLTSADAFCLDGQRLVLVSGTHGATAEYRTELDRFSRVLSYGSDAAKGPDRWLVTTKAGISMHFGATADSNVEAAGRSPAVVLTWALSSTVDQRGNTMTYRYVKDSSIGEHLLQDILYTSNATTTPVLAPYNAVRFEYQTRPDPTQAYVMGSKVSMTRRLNAIRTYINTATDGSGGSVVRQFLVGYTTDPYTGRSLVQSLQDCDASGACLPATTFAWTQRTPADNTQHGPGSGLWGGSQVTTGSMGEATVKSMTGDFNGDGRQDIISSTAMDGIWDICLSTGSSFSCSNWSGPTPRDDFDRDARPDAPLSRVLFGDYNGDGRTDYAVPPTGPVNVEGNWTLCFSTGTSFNCQTSVFWAAGGERASGSNPAGSYKVGDFDGDGRDDLLGVAWNTSTMPYTAVEKLCKSVGSSFTCANYGGVVQAWLSSEDAMLTDLNGDGKQDFLVRTGRYLSQTNNSWTAYLATDSGFIQAFSVQSASPVRDQSMSSSGPFFKRPKDMNGDPYGGYADILVTWFNKSTFIASAELCRSTGLSFDCTVATGLNEHDAHLHDLQDVDGDGKPDVLSHYTVQYVNTDPNRQRLCQVGAGATLTYGPCVDWATTWATAGTLEGDFNGDGLPDRASNGANGWTVNLAGGSTRPHLLARVTNGHGALTEFSYKHLTDDTAYVQDSGSVAAVYPQRDVRDATVVATQMRVDNGLGGWLTTDYRYGGLKTDLAGRGNLGFRWVEATDAVTRVTTRSEYLQSFPFIGRTSRIVLTHANGTELKRVETTFSSSATAVPGAIFTFVQSETETRRDLNGAALATTTTTVPASGAYDAYGNQLSQTVAVVGGGETFTTTTVRTYDNLPANWQIGLERQVQVTKSAPGVPTQTRSVAKDFDGYGNLLRETVEPNTPDLRLATEYGRDGFGNVRKKTVSWIDPVSGTPQQRDTLTQTYEARGRWPATVTNALNQSEIRDHDPATGNPTVVTDINGLTTTTQYDGWGRKATVLRPDGTVIRWAYRQCVDGCAGAVSVAVEQEYFGSTPLETASETFADRLGRTVQTRTWALDGRAVLTQQQYDAFGRLDRSSAPYFADAAPVWTSIDYDDLGRKVAIDEPSSTGGVRRSTIAYDGLSATLTNPKLQTKTKLRNALGAVRQVIDANGQPTSYQYSASGELVRTTDPAGNAIVVTYDGLGRKRALNDPDLGNWIYAVDPLGQTYRQTDAKNQVTEFTFDALGRMTRRLEPDLDSRWEYDTAVSGKGQLAEAYTVKGDGSKDYRRVHRYDSLGRPSQTVVTLDEDYSTTLEYDAYGRNSRKVQARNPIGGSGGPAVAVEFGFNALGHQVQVRSSSSAGSRIESRIEAADAQGRVTRQALGNGLYTHRRYNPYTGTLDSLSTGTSTGAASDDGRVQSDTYQYDALNNLTYRAQRSDDAGGLFQESFDYDALNRVSHSEVSGFGAKTYEYDSIGNLRYRSGVGTYAYPAAGAARPHAVSGITGTVAGLANPTWGYDPNGNVLSGLGRTYTWTTANLPATATRSNAHAGTTVTATFVYGPERQRVRQSLSTGTTLYYGEGVEKEVSAAGTRVKTYLSDAIGYVEEGFSTQGTRYFHVDHLGSVIAITDGAGAVLERLGYDVWGQRRNVTGSDDATYALKGLQDRKGYTGHEHLDEVALVHMNGRVYDPLVGRFTSADPTVPDSKDLQSFNRYSYVLNNPLAYTDPSGFMSFRVGDAFKANASMDVFKLWEEDWLSADDLRMPRSEKKKEEDKKKKEEELKRNCAGSIDLGECLRGRAGAVAQTSTTTSSSNGSSYTCSGGVCIDQQTLVATAQQFDTSTAEGMLKQQIADVGAGWWNAVREVAILYVEGALIALPGPLFEGAAGTKGAYEVAAAGGKHAGFLANYAGRSVAEIEKAIATIKSRVAEHQAWIANPQSKIPHFSKLDPRQQSALLNKKWPSDIARQQEQIEVLKGLLNAR